MAVVHPEVAEQAEWLWQILRDLDDEARGRYFRFVTGSSRRPSAGFSEITISAREGGDGAFPFAHACANTVDLPRYSSPEVMLQRLEAAVGAAHDRFTDL